MRKRRVGLRRKKSQKEQEVKKSGEELFKEKLEKLGIKEKDIYLRKTLDDSTIRILTYDGRKFDIR